MAKKMMSEFRYGIKVWALWMAISLQSWWYTLWNKHSVMFDTRVSHRELAFQIWCVACVETAYFTSNYWKEGYNAWGMKQPAKRPHYSSGGVIGENGDMRLTYRNPWQAVKDFFAYLKYTKFSDYQGGNGWSVLVDHMKNNNYFTADRGAYIDATLMARKTTKVDTFIDATTWIAGSVTIIIGTIVLRKWKRKI